MVQVSRPRGEAVLLCVFVLASLVSGCLSGVEKADQELTGYEEWRPADPTQEDYFVHVEDGFQAPHPFAWSGGFERIATWGLEVTVDGHGLTVGHPVAGEDANGAFRLHGVSGRLVHDEGTVDIDDVRVRLMGTPAFDGAVTASSGGHVTLTPTGASFDSLVPVVLPVPATEAPSSQGDQANETQGGTLLVARGPLSVEAPTVVVGGDPDDDAETTYRNGTLQIPGGEHVRADGATLTLTLDEVRMSGPTAPTDAGTGLRSAGPVGHLRVTAQETSLELRGSTRGLEGGAATVRTIDAFGQDGQTFRAEGSLVQFFTGDRPWIEAEIGFDHPSRDAERDTVTLEVPPGEEFRTMLAARETSGVGSATSILPSKGRDDTGVGVRFGEYWADERIFDETAGRTFFDAVRSIFVIGDSTVSLGPRETAYLPVFFDVPANLSAPAEVEVRLHAQNANIESVLFVLVPNADADTTDVERRDDPAPGAVLTIAVLGALVGVAARRRRR